jgi:cytoskeletal protein CcmA (bactofilin family)
METFSGKITIEADIEIAGMVVGDVTVPSGRTMCLSGMVSGDVIVESIGCAIIRGMVNGCVRNKGGRVEIFGMVAELADSDPNVPSIINQNAIVNGIRY